MQILFTLIFIIAMLAAFGLALAVIVYGVFFLFNFVPWNGIRRRPSTLAAFRDNASAPAAPTEPASRESNCT